LKPIDNANQRLWGSTPDWIWDDVGKRAHVSKSGDRTEIELVEYEGRADVLRLRIVAYVQLETGDKSLCREVTFHGDEVAQVLAWAVQGAGGKLPVAEYRENHWTHDYRWTQKAWDEYCGKVGAI
jgi:hypothetical protein